MYNPAKKSDFLHFLSEGGGRGYLPYLTEIDTKLAPDYFSMTERRENFWSEDLAEMRYTELSLTVKELTEVQAEYIQKNFPSENEFLLSFHRVLYVYNRWSAAQGHHVDRSITKLEWCKAVLAERWVIQSPEHLHKVLEEQFEPVYEETASCRQRAAAWLAYIGLTKSEAASLTKANIDFAAHIIRVNRNGGRFLVQVPEEAMPTLWVLSTASEFKVFRDDLPFGYTKRKREEGTEILRGTHRQSKKDGSVVGSSGEVMIKHIFKDWKSPLLMTYSNIYKCGAFYRAYQEECNISSAFRQIQLPLEEIEQFVQSEASRGTGDRAVYKRKVYKEYRLWKMVSGHS